MVENGIYPSSCTEEEELSESSESEELVTAAP